MYLSSKNKGPEQLHGYCMLICTFVFANAKSRFSHDVAQLISGKYKVGVHIADVSWFIDEGSILDKVAGLRATSVYLVHKVCTTIKVLSFLMPMVITLITLNVG